MHRSFIQVPFLNLMANIKQRAGKTNIRVGGNSQETATLVDSLPNNAMIAKDTADTSNPVSYPDLIMDYLYSKAALFRR